MQDIPISITDFPKTRLLQVNSCGTERITKNEYTVYRPFGRKDFHFLYLKEGWLNAEIGEEKIVLHKGDCAVFFPDIKQKYTFSKEGNPVTLWLHFTGDAVAEAMSHINQNGITVYSISQKTLFESLFIKLIKVHNFKSPSFVLEENSILLQLITIIAKESENNKITKRNEILNAMEYLSLNFSNRIDLIRLSNELNLSYSRFLHLFTETTGISPHQYLLKLRLNHAGYLLKYTDMSISDIAINVGYPDNYYFSRLFKKKYSVPPKEYRKQNKLKASGEKNANNTF